MGRRPDLTPPKKTKIDVLRRVNQWSGRRIALELDLSHSAVNKYLAFPDKPMARKGKGRPKSITEVKQRRIIALARRRRMSAAKIRNRVRINSSVRTVQRVLAADPNLVWTKMTRKPPLTSGHKERRMNFASEHVTWTNEWRKVVFSDEKKFNLDGPDGLSYYWHDLRDEPRVISRRNFGGGSVMVWAAFGYHGKTAIIRLNGRQDSSAYQDTLANHLLPIGSTIAESPWIFQQDNAAIHTSRSTLRWFEANMVTLLEWPSRSPDLNPMENLWGWLARRVYQDGRQFRDAQELQSAIEESWSEVPQVLLESLVDSMVTRMKAVLVSHGGSTKY